MKLTRVPGPAHASTLILIPGGPGLSSKTLRSLDSLSRLVTLVYVDFPGCGGTPYDRDRSFEELAHELASEVAQLAGDLHVLGHSFGGYFAAEVALSCPDVQSLVCLSTPFSASAIDSAIHRYEAGKTEAIAQAELKWAAAPSDQNLAAWLSAYGPLYFRPHSTQAGRDLLLNDACSHRAFLHHQRDMRHMERLLAALSSWDGKKLFLAESEGLIAPDALRADAARGEFEFEVVPDSSHFLMFDQPEWVARLIESFVATPQEHISS